jgi:hypothetical protein
VARLTIQFSIALAASEILQPELLRVSKSLTFKTHAAPESFKVVEHDLPVPITQTFTAVTAVRFRETRFHTLAPLLESFSTSTSVLLLSFCTICPRKLATKIPPISPRAAFAAGRADDQVPQLRKALEQD